MAKITFEHQVVAARTHPIHGRQLLIRTTYTDNRKRSIPVSLFPLTVDNRLKAVDNPVEKINEPE